MSERKRFVPKILTEKYLKEVSMESRRKFNTQTQKSVRSRGERNRREKNQKESGGKAFKEGGL